MDKERTHEIVREAYGQIALTERGCGCGPCGPDPREFTKSIGYTDAELALSPDAANLALSCGTPPRRLRI
jgi:hypothetical protein